MSPKTNYIARASIVQMHHSLAKHFFNKRTVSSEIMTLICKKTLERPVSSLCEISKFVQITFTFSIFQYFGAHKNIGQYFSHSPNLKQKQISIRRFLRCVVLRRSAMKCTYAKTFLQLSALSSALKTYCGCKFLLQRLLLSATLSLETHTFCFILL